MSTLRILALIALLAGAVSPDAADYYKLPDIQRIQKDLYRSAKVIIETRACFHLPVDEEDALLKYQGPGQYEIVWEDRSTCDVQRFALTETIPI